MFGPSTEFSERLHAQKYRGEGESFREAMGRVANALKDSEEHYHEFRDILLEMRFLPAGRVQAAMGSLKSVTPYNCFVSGTIEDSLVDGHGSIMDRAKEAAATMRMGGGIGYDFSTLRPRGKEIKKLGSKSTGPRSFMEIYDAICRCIASSGHRRGAQMGVMRIDHPDIEEFIRAKHNQDQLTGFNISAAITDEFMECLAAGRPFPLKWGGEIYREVDPEALWDIIMRSTWDWAEPGVLFIDTINRMNNLWYCEEIAATNPCGEQPLPPYGACLLGSLNMPKYLSRVAINQYTIAWDQLLYDIPHIVRAMDNIVDRAIYPLYEQEKEAKNKRRMGLGVTGLANCIEALGHPYGSPEAINLVNKIMATINRACYLSSIELSKEKGPFPLFDAELYGQSEFDKTLDTDVQELIARHGMRNSHVTSVAPTGTISLCADNVSSGIEPVFAKSVDRTVNDEHGPRVVTIEDYGVRVLNVEPRVASKVTLQEHLAVLSAAYKHVDSAVSKTCNVPSDTSWEDFKQVYIQAHEQGCKGCTTFRMDGKRFGILNVREDDSAPSEEDLVGVTHQDVDEPAPACRIDGETGRRECE